MQWLGNVDCPSPGRNNNMSDIIIGGDSTCEYCGTKNPPFQPCNRCNQGIIRGTDTDISKIPPYPLCGCNRRPSIKKLDKWFKRRY